MHKNTKRIISSVLSAVMTVGIMANSFITTAMADVRKVDVWDFGGVQQDGDMYQNYIDADFLDNMDFVGDSTVGNTGKFLADGTYSFGGDLSVNAKANDRMYYEVGSGTKNYGTLSTHALTAFSDGYTADGEYYCNGTGGDSRRYVQIDNCYAGDVISVYVNNSNSTSDPHYTVLTNLSDSSVEDVSSLYDADNGSRSDMIVPADGSYKVWINSPGKPIFNRVVRYPAVTVSGTIDLAGNAVSSYGLKMTNKTTNVDTEATVNSDGTFTAVLSPGYTYTATLTGATGYGFTNATKTVTVDTSDCATGTVTGVSLVVEVKSTYKASGEITGFASDYDLSNLTLTLVPTEESLCDTVEVALDGTSFSGVLLEPDVDYTAALGGVNDYEIVSGGVFNNTVDMTQNIEVAEKATYTASGSLIDVPSGSSVTSLTLTNVEDGYVYTGTVSGSTYSAVLRNGAYSVSVDDTTCRTATHIVVNGKAVSKDLLFVSTDTTVQTVDWSADVYVGDSSKSPNYDTVNEAMAAIAGMGVDSEAERVTVHIAPGTYREQIMVETPYITFENADPDSGAVILTWYYGIGYAYYSSDSTGYYNYESLFDAYEKNSVSKWGCSTYVKEAATGFKASGITFEASFNKYMTDEEIADGVEVADDSLPTRRLSSDVTAKSFTERATALAIEADNVEFEDCSFIGSQDTLYTGSKDYNLYFKNCYVEGNTDYIFGDGNCVFDACTLMWCGYSDTAMGGYLTAAKDVAAYGYLFRNCVITAMDGMQTAAGYFGRPWSAGARVTFQDTKLADELIQAEGWTSMSGNSPANANFAEYNTTYGGSAVDTSSRTNAVSASRPVTDVTTYFGDWTPTYYTAESGTPAFVDTPSLRSTGDINIPRTGETITVLYVLNDEDNDASQISWYLVAADGTETLVAAETANYTPDSSAEGCYVKVVVTPRYISGAEGTAASFITETALQLGSEGSGTSADTTRVGDTAVFLVGDSTVKDYSAGAINNSGATANEGSWGEFLQEFFDESDVQVYDYAQGGRSSKTFLIDDTYMDEIATKIQAGDYLFIQFGHNDCAETYTDRYVPLGDPDENGIYPITAPTDDEGGATVATRGTYKYYLNEYIEFAKEYGATPVLVTPVSRMYFNSDGTIYAHHCTSGETENTYCTAVEQLADETGTALIDLFTYSKGLYEQAYADDSTASGNTSALATRLFASGEKTHHSKMGGFILAIQMAEFIKTMGFDISDDVIAPSGVDGLDANDDNEFTVSMAGVFTAYDKDDNGSYTVVDEYWTGIGNTMIAELTGTEPVTPSPSEDEYAYGDASGDGVLDASDAADVLQKVLDDDYQTPIEAAGASDYVSVLDVDTDGLLTSNDAAVILQKVLDADYVMPCEA